MHYVNKSPHNYNCTNMCAYMQVDLCFEIQMCAALAQMCAEMCAALVQMCAEMCAALAQPQQGQEWGPSFHKKSDVVDLALSSKISLGGLFCQTQICAVSHS